MPRRRSRSRQTTKTSPQPRAPTPLTPAQANRVRIMREKGVTITTIAQALNDDGVEISRQAVSDIVTRGLYMDVPKTKRSRESVIIDRFCEMTQTSRLDAWPDRIHEDDDESDPSVVARINRARGVTDSTAATGGRHDDRAAAR